MNNALTNHAYLSKSQQVMLHALNECLHRHEPMMSKRIWQSEQTVKDRIADDDDWINDGHCESRVVFTWCADAPELLSTGSVVAAVIEEHYTDETHRARWQSFEGWHNDAVGRDGVYPVAGKHNIWFHALYDHLYGDKKLSWAQLSRLGGCYLEFEQTYQCGIELSQYEGYPMHNPKSLTDIGVKRQIGQAVDDVLNQLISSYEPLCRHELIQQDHRCSHEMHSSGHPLFDYDLMLRVWLSDPTNDEDEEPAFILTCKDISQMVTKRIRGENARTNLRVKGFHALVGFLRHELMLRAKLEAGVIRFSDWLYVDINVNRKESAIGQFDAFTCEASGEMKHES